MAQIGAEIPDLSNNKQIVKIMNQEMKVDILAPSEPVMPWDGDFERDQDKYYNKSNVWCMGSISRMSDKSTALGSIYCGEIIPYPRNLEFSDVLSIVINNKDKLTNGQEEYIRLFRQIETKKKGPTWRICVRTAGVIKATPEFLNFHAVRDKNRHCIRTCYEITNKNQLYIYPLMNNKMIAPTFAESSHLIKQSISLNINHRSDVFCWNEIFPLIWPNLPQKMQYFPRLRWKDSNYVIDENSTNETDTEDGEDKRPKYISNDLILSLPCGLVIYPNDYHRPRSEKVNFEEFYEKIALKRKKPPNYQICMDLLTCQLRPYQIEAVQFMMDRELRPQIELQYDLFNSFKLYSEINYFQEFGIFCNSDEKPVLSVRGGILADEMGLGKTVELLALIFSLRPDNCRHLKYTVENYKHPIVSDSVLDTVDNIVNIIVSQEEGARGLDLVLKSKLLRPDTRVKNVYFNTDSRHFTRQPETIAHMAKIICTECGTSCLKEKMHWQDEYNIEGIPFVCPDCVFNGPTLDSKATLIVVPQILIHQWYEEIKRHVRENVIIDVYMGVERDGYKHPAYLSRCDVVLTSYETLRSEIGYLQPGTPHNLRKRTYERQKQVTSPLISIKWWRICLDESQLVENSGRQASQMVAKLNGRARWCVTGTPLMTGPDDFYGLVCFLELYPFNLRNVWLGHMYNPYLEGKKDRLLNFVSTFFWRNSVKSVRDQMHLPPIKHEIIHLNFTPLEERLYQQQLIECIKNLEPDFTIYRDTSQKIADLSDHEQKRLMGFFNIVRLFTLTGGCHENKKRQGQMKDDTRILYSSEMLFKRLFSTNRTYLEDRIREFMYGTCFLGGLHLLYRPSQAIEIYNMVPEIEEIIEKVNEQFNKNKIEKPIRIDRTQMIHYYKAQLDYLMVSCAKDEDGNICNPEIESMIADLRTCKEEYVSKELNNIIRFSQDFQHIEDDWKVIDQGFENMMSWILVFLEGMKPAQMSDLRQWIMHTELNMAPDIEHIFVENRSWTRPYRIFFYLKEQMIRQQGNLAELRRRVFGLFGILEQNENGERPALTSEDFQLQTDCYHNAFLIGMSSEFDEENEEEMFLQQQQLEVPRAKRNKLLIVEDQYTRFNCSLCDMEKYVKKMEKALHMTDGTKRIPLESSDWYLFFRELLKKRVSPGYRPHYQQTVKWLEQCRKTVLFSHKVIVALKEFVCRCREIKQAEKRIQKGENVAGTSFLTSSFHLPQSSNYQTTRLIDQWKHKIDEYKTKIKNLQIQINYISSLNEEDKTKVERQCPVCLDEITTTWNVFPCAHYVCHTCCKRIQVDDNKLLSCVTCRAKCLPDNIVTVVQEPEQKEPLPGLKKGELNVKYDAVLRQLLKVLNADITNKVLIFTSLTECLDSFCCVLQKANVKYNRLQTLDPIKVATFRNDPTIRVMVIPLHTGASGLNLTQANTVFFLEPSVEKATIAQAIGRMARLGQYRSMTVYNFIIKGSVEEEIQQMVSDLTSENGWTVDRLHDILANSAAHLT